MFQKEIFASRVKETLKEKGHTQKDLANGVSCVEGTVSKWLNDDSHALPDVGKLYAIADYLGVSADWLMGRTEHRQMENQLSARDVCRSFMRYMEHGCLNLQSTRVKQTETCVDNYDDESVMENEYSAYFFSERFAREEPGENYAPYAAAINSFLKSLQIYTRLYRNGELDSEDYDLLVGKALDRVSDQPLP